MSKGSPTVEDRLLIRGRPEGTPIMHQSWGKLLFMHWPVTVEALRPHIPGRLEIDTFEGRAWVGVTPFTLWDVRPTFTPAVPWLSEFHELNVRTYVHLEGVPGVWFFSLDANSLVAVTGARALYRLPYHYADISLEERGDEIVFTATRERAEGAPAEFRAAWTVGGELPEAEPGSLEFFLVERYCLYAEGEEKLYRARISHRPWPLREASLSGFRSTVVEADGLPTPAGDPLLHHGGPVSVEVWPPEEV